MSQELNKYSSRITQPKSQGASQAMLYGTGMTEEDMNKAQVGIASVWYEGNPCNMHLLDLAKKVKEGVVAADLVGMRFNTIGVSDGISMGTDGMSYSLQSRDLIADSIETIMGGQWYDGLVALPGCDKNMPGCLMAMGRLNRPSIMVYGGTIKPGFGANDDKRDIVSAFQCYGEFLAGTIDPARRLADVFGQMQKAVVASERVFEVFDREPSVRDPRSPEQLPRHQRSLVLSRVAPGTAVTRVVKNRSR